MLLAPVQAAADWVATLKGWKRALLAAFAGAISVLAFAPLHVWPVLFLSFGLLVWLLDGCHAGHARLGTRLRCATLIGFWFGFGYFLTGLYWTAEAFLVEPWRHGWLIPFAMTGLAGGMALFYAAAAALAAILWRPGAARVFAVAIAFGLAEFARGHVLTGLPWNLVGYGLAATLPMMQAASIFGVYALSLLALLLFASLFAIWSPQGSGLARPISTALVVRSSSRWRLLAARCGERRGSRAQVPPPPACGSASSRPMSIRPTNGALRTAPRSSTPISISPSPAAALKGSTASRLWSGRRRRFPSSSPTPLRRFTKSAMCCLRARACSWDRREWSPSATPTDVLPPSASTTVSSWSATRVRSSAATTRSISCRSANIFRFRISWRASGFLQLTGIRGGFSAGTGPRLLSIPGAPLARPLICYEIIFPDEVADNSQRPGWFLNVTNDAWFGTSAGPFQHFHQAQLRAVEQGLPVVRAANTGISAIIDPYGRVLVELGLKQEGVVDGLLPEASPSTKFVMWGRWIELAVLSLALVGYLAFSRWFGNQSGPPRNEGIAGI